MSFNLIYLASFIKKRRGGGWGWGRDRNPLWHFRPKKQQKPAAHVCGQRSGTPNDPNPPLVPLLFLRYYGGLSALLRTNYSAVNHSLPIRP